MFFCYLCTIDNLLLEKYDNLQSFRGYPIAARRNS